MPELFSAFDTVPMLTPAAVATSRIVWRPRAVRAGKGASGFGTASSIYLTAPLSSPAM